ncbi:hypothetical protein [Parvularcula dongshanensis]|uniref:hypothetical protein n=1 Tax=Parvularcula dongshanensis TaxID=1173995 RepID=UPI0016135D49|nr:hypothetical protein [Parvularcula dongshanensis]
MPRHVHVCDGEERCGLAGLPHLFCVPVPPYAEQKRSEEDEESASDQIETLACPAR